MPDPFASVKNVMNFQAQVESWKQEDRIRRARKEKRKWLEDAYKFASKTPGGAEDRPWVKERIERDLIRWESAYRRGKKAGIGPFAVEAKAGGAGLGRQKRLTSEEQRNLKAQGIETAYDTTRGDVPALAKALIAKTKAAGRLVEQSAQRQWDEYKLDRGHELTSQRLLISDALRQRATDIKWERGEDKRALENQQKVMNLEKTQRELIELRKPVEERADNIFKLMLKQIDLGAKFKMEELKQQGRVDLAEVRGEEQRLKKLTKPPKEDSLSKFKRVLPRMQTVGDILRYYAGEKYKTEDAWNLTRLAAESLNIVTDVNFDSSAEDKMEFYRTALPVPMELDAKSSVFSAYSSYNEVEQMLQEWGMNPQVDPEAADILIRARQYFQYTGGATGGF